MSDLLGFIPTVHESMQRGNDSGYLTRMNLLTALAVRAEFIPG
jgi:hypothetical protein